MLEDLLQIHRVLLSQICTITTDNGANRVLGNVGDDIPDEEEPAEAERIIIHVNDSVKESNENRRSNNIIETGFY